MKEAARTRGHHRQGGQRLTGPHPAGPGPRWRRASESAPRPRGPGARAVPTGDQGTRAVPTGDQGLTPSPPGTGGHTPSPKKTGHKLFPLKVCGASSPWRLGHPVCLSPRRPGVEHVYGPSHALSILEATQEVAGGGPLRPSEQHQRGANKTRGLNKTQSHATLHPKCPGENVNYSSHQERRRSQTK